jgi:histidinol dehydrogenase
MSASELSILRIDTRVGHSAVALLAEIRARLAPDGNIVSEEGRQRTIAVFGEPLSPGQVVERICRDVRENGLAALLDYSARIDSAHLDALSLRVPPSELAAAHKAADADFLAAVRRIRENILTFQSAILHRDVKLPAPGGGYLKHRYTPLARVGICVPGGAAAYPSTVLMTAVPAQAAGVKELAVIAPPTKFGAYNADLLATCHEIGVREVYRMGGAQGVAALAYGVQGVPKVDKIVGPGNLFVALAKRYVYGQVDIDSIAGPSEVVVIADDSASPDHTAADLVAQAEHSPGASILITWSETLLDQTQAAIGRQLANLDRGDLARASLEAFGALILVRNPDEAVRLAASLAPEHLHIATAQPETLMNQITTAGATFLGHWSPVATGDYVAGPSHVLPTGGAARFSSGLSANDFRRSSSVVCFDQQGLARVADDIRLLARREGLTGHGASVDIRLKGGSQ